MLGERRSHKALRLHAIVQRLHHPDQEENQPEKSLEIFPLGLKLHLAKVATLALLLVGLEILQVSMSKKDNNMEKEEKEEKQRKISD